MDLEKAYDRVDLLAMWDVLNIYGVGGKLLSAINFFFFLQQQGTAQGHNKKGEKKAH